MVDPTTDGSRSGPGRRSRALRRRRGGASRRPADGPRALTSADELGRIRLYDTTCATAYDLAMRMLRDPSRAERALETAYAEVWTRLPLADLRDPHALVEVLVSVRQAARDLAGPGAPA